MGLGSNVTTTPKSSATLSRMYLAIQIVAHGDPFARSNLELPLGGHHLGVGAAHVDPGVQTSHHMGCLDVSPIHLSGSDSTVVRSLRSRVAILWPTEWMLVSVE